MPVISKIDDKKINGFTRDVQNLSNFKIYKQNQSVS